MSEREVLLETGITEVRLIKIPRREMLVEKESNTKISCYYYLDSSNSDHYASRHRLFA